MSQQTTTQSVELISSLVGKKLGMRPGVWLSQGLCRG
ncbi:Uncharacterised protein [Serratia marcescens]|nr:Uncharacterised protein [Serratia marcescens]